MKRRSSSLWVLSGALLITTTAHAHPGSAWHEGFSSGVLHPLVSWDHAIVMVAVGLWGSTLGIRSMVALPLVFMTLMTAGIVAASSGFSLPAENAGTAASALVLGTAVALGVRAPLTVSMPLGGLFAFFHGHAHGENLLTAAHPAAWALGLLAATLALHALGVVVGRAASSPAARVVVRSAGLLITAGGLAALIGIN